MKRIKQFFRNIKMSSKLLISYFLIALVAVGGIGGALYHSARRQIQAGEEQVFQNAAQMSAQLLQERCGRVLHSLNYLAMDTNVLQIVNKTNYISEYEKANDVTGILDPTILNICQQNALIQKILFFTSGEIKGTRDYFLDLEENRDSPFLAQGGLPQWRRDGEILAVSRVLVNVWDPADSATVAVVLNQDALFQDLLPLIDMDCRVTILDAAGTPLYTAGAAADTVENSRHRVDFSDTVEENGWQICVTGVTRAEFSQSAMQNVLLIIAAVTVLMLVTGGMFSISISARVAHLREQMETVVDSQYQCDISSDDRDEIGMITNAVGNMVSQTRDLILQKYQSELMYQDAKIQALQAQINPHFLYNTLSNLNWRAIAKGDLEMSRLLTMLSRFYRLSLNSGRIDSTVEMELQHIRHYIELYAAIHDHASVAVDWQIDQSLLACEMPCMILQPLVENAFEHGQGAGGLADFRLCVRVFSEAEQTVIQVADNGHGMPLEKREAVLRPPDKDSVSLGYGLHNVYNRLRLYFANACDMTFRDTPGGGTTVEIRFTARDDMGKQEEHL